MGLKPYGLMGIVMLFGPTPLIISPLPELPENWTDTRETLLEGMAFNLKYLGITLVEEPKGEELSAAAVKRIVATVSATPTLPVSLRIPECLVLGHSQTSVLVVICRASKVH